MLTAELVRPSNTDTVSISQVVEQYNNLAGLLNLKPVKKFENKAVALRRLAVIQAEAQERFKVTPERKKRQKVFSYPPLEKLSVLKAGTLRAEARDLLANGATVARVEQLIADWDVRTGKKPHRLEPRAYGLIRLLHTYVGYALREEIVNGQKIIYVMTREEWLAWKATQK